MSEAAAAGASDPKPKGSLRRLAVRGSLIEFGGFGFSQALRLGGNILLTGLLFPEAMGLLALVSIITQGLYLLSDVGIQQAVMQNSRGDEPEFLNTAWTMQVVRGAVLCTGAVLLSYPVSLIYGEPQLFGLVCAGGVQLLIHGFQSTAMFTMRRRVTLGWPNAVDLGGQVVTTIVMIAAALVWPSVWSLMIGGLAGTLAHTLATHRLPVGYRNRFTWHREDFQRIVAFGRWIFGSSAIFYFGKQGDRLLLARYLGPATVGIYSIAVMVSEAVGTVVERISHGVLYPIFSEVVRSQRERLPSVFYRARLRLDALSLPALGVLTVWGDQVVVWLWDDRYIEAGWMLQLLTIRTAMVCLFAPGETCLTAMGLPRFGFLRSVVKTVAVLIGVPIGHALAGLKGVVWAAALSELPSVFVLWPALASLQMLRLRRELLAITLYGAGVAIGFGAQMVAASLGLVRV